MQNRIQKIAIQGVKGAFHEEAARVLFGDEITIEPCLTFKELVHKIVTDQIEFGVMAIENTISGTILDNLELIASHDLQIQDEVYLRIQQNLGAVKGADLSTIKKVYSHYMALNQCRSFFESYPEVCLVESMDTALSVMEVAKSGNTELAAIGSRLAIEFYGLDLIAESIETDKKNYTRFVTVSKQKCAEIHYDKVSLSLTLPHKKGSLATILNLLSDFDVNLTKIESVPILGRPWEYRFYLDYIHSDLRCRKELLNCLLERCDELKILGKYKSQQTK